MTKTNTTTPSLQIRLKLHTIQTNDSVKVQKSSPSPKSKSRKKTHSKKRKARSPKTPSDQIDVVNNDKSSAPAKATTNQTYYWTSERVESTKLILRTVVMAN